MSTELLLELVESAPDALVVAGPEGDIVLVNRQAELMFGYLRSELLGQPVELLVPEQLRSRHAGHRQAYVREPKTRPMGVGLDLAARRKDGTEFPVEVSLSPARVAGGMLVSSSIRDVSERRRMEQALRESEQRFAAFFRNSATPFAIAEAHSGTYLDVNEAFCRLLGWSRAELVGWNALQLGILPDARARSTLLASIDPERGSGAHEARMRTRDGRELDVLVTMTRIESGGHECIAKSLVDMTERRRAREAVDQALRRVEEAERATGRGNWEWDLEADRARWSPGMYHVLGVDPATFDNRNENFLALVHPEDRDRLASAMAAALDSPGPFLQEYRVVRPDGQVRHLRGEGDMVAGAHGRVRTMYGFVQDVTEAKAAERALLERTRELEQANQELDSFAYSVSHDLRAPLRAMAGFAQILLEEHAAQLGPEARHCVETVVESAREMGHLVDDLLALSRLGRQALAVQEADPAAIARKAFELERSAMAGRDVEVVVGPMPRVRADPSLLQQVYANLVGNAVKFTSRKERARIEAGWDPDLGAFYVRDNGVGFDMRHAGRLFGAFQRMHRAEEYAGTGIGLAIVQRVVARHGGKVWAEAEPDRGATFLFTLPEVLDG